MADVPVSAPQTQVAQLEATIRSAHALLQAGLINEATILLAAFSPEVQPNIDRGLLDDLAYFVKITRHISSVNLRGKHGELNEGSDSLSRKLRRATT